MSYVDGYVIAVPTANKQKFIDHARTADAMFVEFGATRIVEAWEDDVKDGKLTDFRRAVQATPDESIVFSWVEWPDKRTRDAAMARMMAPDFDDPRMDPQRNPMPFDGKRLIFGGGERYSQTPPRDIAAFVRPFMAQVFPQIADAGIDYGWGGAVAVTMNRLPHIGRRGNVFFAHGFSGHGALVTTLAGELIAEAMAGTAERFDVLANLPSRPFPGGKWLRQPLATLGLLYYALKDRLG